MDKQKVFKVEITPKAYLAIKVQSTLSGIDAKSYVSDLILKNIDKKTNEIVDLMKEATISENENAETITENEIETDQEAPVLDNADLVFKSLCSNPSFARTSQELSGITGITSEEINIILDMLLKEKRINSRMSGNDREYWIPGKAGIKTQQIYDIMTPDPEKAQTLEEVAKISKINKFTTQSALYWLLREGKVQRRLRENSEDKRKRSWEYWKIDTASPLKKKGIDFKKLLDLLPDQQDHAISVHELATKLHIPNTTVRDALKRLEHAGQVKSLQGVNSKNQTIIVFYRTIKKNNSEMPLANNQQALKT